MGYMAHDAVVVVDSPFEGKPSPDIDAFRASMPKDLRQLVIGPVAGARNGYRIYAFLPDGSKEFWDMSDVADEWRERFKALFAGSSWAEGVCVRFGGDFAVEFGEPLVSSFEPAETAE
jgi:hypothetical protein